jgi:hypothetical protein
MSGPEEPAAASPRPRPLAHSAGIILLGTDPGGPVSFRIEPTSSHVVDVGGWGRTGPLPLDVRHWVNGPPSPMACHTALVTDDDPGSLFGVYDLIGKHGELYGETKVYVAPDVPHAIANWVKGGCRGDLTPPSMSSSPGPRTSSRPCRYGSRSAASGGAASKPRSRSVNR